MRYIGLVSIPSLCTALAACISVGPTYDEPPLDDAQDAFIAADEPVFAGERTDAAWWTAFDDETLTKVVTIARGGNLDVAEAIARVEAADAQLRSVRRSLLPQGQASGSIQRQEQAAAAFAAFAPPGGFGGGGDDGDGGEVPDQGPIDIYTVAADVTWELDLFGRIKNQTRQQRANADAQAALAADTLRLVTARVADAYLAYREAAALSDVAARNLDSQTRALELTDALFEMGEIAEFDVARQRTVALTTKATAERVAGAKAQAASALALLCGLTVPSLAEAVPTLEGNSALPSPPETLALSDPAAVLRRRPDVAIAERQLAAATYNIGVQTAQLFPQVSVTGNASLTALDFGGLSQSDAFGYSYGPRLSWPIFSYPQLLAQVDAADAQAEAALYAYQRTVLAALTETDEALVVYARSLGQARALEGAQESASRALTLAEVRYREGADSLLAYLDAQRTALQTEEQFVVARSGALRARVAVHRALAD